MNGRALAHLLAGLGAISLLAGCTASQEVPSPAPTAQVTSDPPATPQRMASARAMVPADRKILASQEDQQGSSPLVSFDVTTDKIYVYVTCLGDGPLTIKVDPAGSFDLPCANIAQGSANEFQVSDWKQISVNVTAQAGQVWSAAVAEEESGTD